MDELDDELFGKSKTKISTSGKPRTPTKTVTFKTNSPANDIDLDDPLAGILSEEESVSKKKDVPSNDSKKKPTNINFDDNNDRPFGINRSKPSMQDSNIEKTSVVKENLFDDDKDMLGTLGLDEDRPKAKSDKLDDDFMSPLDKLLTKSSTDSSQKHTVSGRKFRFDKDGNLITDKLTSLTADKPINKGLGKPTADKEDLSFGSYFPSTAGSRRNRRSAAPKQDDNFLSFLDEDVGKSATAKKVSTSKDVSKASPVRASDKRIANADFLELGEEIDIDSSSEDSKKPHSPPFGKTDDDFLSFLTKDTPLSPNKKATLSTPGSRPGSGRTSGMRSNVANFLEHGEEIDIDSATEKINKSPASPTSSSKPDSTSSNNPTEKSNKSMSVVSSQPSSYLPPQIQPLTTVTLPSDIPLTYDDPFANISAHSFVPSASLPNRPIPKHFESVGEKDNLRLSTQVSPKKELMKEVKKTFNEDLNVAKQAYEERIQTLRAEVEEIKLRSDREVDAIKESYNMRMEIMRKQMKDQFEDIYDKDSTEQSEIKKLRALHLNALEDTRLDYESRIKMMQESHRKDIEAIKSSTGYVRNLEGMMTKVDTSVELLDSLSRKYESVFHGMTQKWNDMAAENKRFMSGFKIRIEEIHQNNVEMQNNLQITVSRLEGSMSEMSRSMRESQSQMQLERNRLESLQSSIENEKKQLLQQVATERADAMNAYREAVELRQKYERGMREDNDRLRQWQEYLLQSQRVLEEARSAEVKQTADRENEWRRIENHLARERSEVVEKTERLASLEARLQVQKEELERREAALQLSEKRKLEKEEDLRNREEELKIGEERAAKKLAASMNVLEEAKRVEEEYEARLNDIHNDSNTLAKQRQLLAEERKQLIEDRITHQTSDVIGNNLSSPRSTPNKAFALTKKDVFTPSKAATASAALWMFTAQKDREFLEDEQIFLDALKMSPLKNSDKTFYE